MEMYHVWDFDITLGNCNYSGFENPAGWQMKGAKWYDKMFQDPTFVCEVKERWNKLYPQFEKLPEFIESQVELLDGAQDRNFTRWNILNEYVWPNVVWLGSYDAEVKYLCDYYTKRIKWLNEQLNAL